MKEVPQFLARSAFQRILIENQITSLIFTLSARQQVLGAAIPGQLQPEFLDQFNVQESVTCNGCDEMANSVVGPCLINAAPFLEPDA